MRFLNRRISLLGVLCLVFLWQTAMGEDPATANRDAVKKCVLNLASRAQRYYYTPLSEGGGQGSFATCTLGVLISYPLNAYGSFYLTSPSATSVTFVGTGIEIGNDGSTPVQAIVVVYADSITVTVTN